MTILIDILLVIAVLLAIIFTGALFVKKDYIVSRSVTINKNKAFVFNYVKIVKNQDYYNKWWTMDPNAKKEFRGEDGTIGFVAAWDSENKQAGKGEQEIINIKDGERIDFEIRFQRPFQNTANSYMATETVTPDQTKLSWVFIGKNKYPFNLMNLFMGNLLGNDLQTSITNLKTVLEK